MNDSERVLDLVLQWEEMFEKGQDVAPEELCRDCSELSSAVAGEIAALRRMAWVKNQRPCALPPDAPGIGGGLSHCSCPERERAEETDDSFGTPVQPKEKLLAGRYRLERVIGEGGTGQVWQALDTQLGRPVAVKCARQDRPLARSDAERLMAEARRAAQLRNAGIVAVHDVYRHGDGCFIVSDLVNGTDLRRHLLSGPLPVLAALRIAAEAAEALHYAHQHNIVHRDVKPGNILLDGTGHVFVTDFGIALTREELPRQGGDGSGTLAYMSPEQFSSQERQLDHRTDIYSLGVVLYELLTGERPFHGETFPTMKDGVLHATPRSLRSVKRDIPREAERICLQCLAKDPAARYASAQDLAKDLRRLLARLSKGRLLLSLVVVGVTVALALYNVYLLSRSVINVRIYDKEHYDRVVDQGVDRLNRKEYQTAVSLFDTALRMQPSVVLFCLKAQAHFGLNEYEKTIECCENALRLDPTFPKAHYLKGMVCWKTNRLEQALVLFDRAACESAPNASEARKVVEAELIRVAASKENDIKGNRRDLLFSKKGSQ